MAMLTRTGLRASASKGLQFSTAAGASYNFEQLYSRNHLGLPRLPIPNLTDTIERYLASVRPLVGPEEFAAHEALVRDFQRTEAEKLHQKLLAIDAKDAASGTYPYYYFEAVWDEGYLAARDPIPINTNPALVFDSKPGQYDQVNISAAFLHNFGKWAVKLRSGQMGPDGSADMSQYYFQVGSGRVPRLGRDIAVSDHSSHHAVVIHRDRFFKLDLITPGGQHATVPALEQALRQVLASDAPATQIGRLTTTERDAWAVNREKLENASLNNVNILKAIDTALMVLVLEDAEPTSHYDGLPLWLMGVESRWYDKHQLIVAKNGFVGINLEHAFGDGMTWLRWMGEVWTAIQGKTAALPAVKETPQVPAVHALQWDVPAAVAQAAAEADTAFRAAVKNVDLKALCVDIITRDEMKKRQMPPDSTAQVAFQFAHQRLHGFMAPTYESCSTRGFFHGRTETIRSATTEAQQFALAMLDSSTTAEARWGLFQAAAAKHSRLAREAAQGQGVDRHLMMLKILGKQEAKPHPFLLDPLLQRSSTWRLSSSNLSNPILGPLCFGAVVPHGYGIGYSLLAHRLSFAVASFANNDTTDTAAFCDSLEQSLKDIVTLARQAGKA
eukprot:EG_transcript_4462